MCFDPVSQSTCLPIDYGSNSHTVSNAFGPSNHVLPAGQAILYALSPKYTNVDIRIMLDVTFGQMSVFISSRPDIFLVRYFFYTYNYIFYIFYLFVHYLRRKILMKSHLSQLNKISNASFLFQLNLIFLSFLFRSDPSSGKHIVYPDERMVNVESTKFRSRRNIKDSNINATNAKYKDIFSRLKLFTL